MRTLREIRAAGARAGLGINPATPVEPYADLLAEVDMLLLMTVEPGFGGQHFLDMVLNAQTKGPVNFPCDVNVIKGEELGWFEHGSTIIILAPGDFAFCDGIGEGTRIRSGQRLEQCGIYCFHGVDGPGRERGARFGDHEPTGPGVRRVDLAGRFALPPLIAVFLGLSRNVRADHICCRLS